jgi:hypothetical protein
MLYETQNTSRPTKNIVVSYTIVRQTHSSAIVVVVFAANAANAS